MVLEAHEVPPESAGQRSASVKSYKLAIGRSTTSRSPNLIMEGYHGGEDDLELLFCEEHGTEMA